MPRNIVIPITAMIASVSAAFRACGRRNAGTPSAIASTPVSAVAPDENARRIANSRSRSPWWRRCGSVRPAPSPDTRSGTARGRADEDHDRCDEPVGGDGEQVPDSLVPRRLAIVTSQTNAIARITLCSLAAGAADPIAKTPATIETTTVIM